MCGVVEVEVVVVVVVVGADLVLECIAVSKRRELVRIPHPASSGILSADVHDK